MVKPVASLLLALCGALVGFSLRPSPALPEKPKWDITVESRLGFDATIEALKSAAAANKYGFQGMHDVSAVLTEKGYPRERLTVLEFCNPLHASNALKQDINAGLMIPCPIMVWQDGDKVMVSALNAGVMGQMLRGEGMSAIGNDVAGDLRTILGSVQK